MMHRTTQIGWVMIIAAVFLVVYSWFIPVSLNQRYWMFGIAAILLLLFYRLTIEVTPQHVKFILGIGLIQKTYPMANIVYCRTISYIPFGWGIRLRPGVILFNVSGNKAIELSVRGKNRLVWIGTNTPEEVCSHVNEMLNQHTEKSHNAL